MRKKVSVLLAAIIGCGLLLSGCGGTETDAPGGGDRGDATKIVIYAGGSSEFSWVKGSEETEIIDHIEQAYYEDTGVSLDFEITYSGKDLTTQMNNAMAGGDQLDIAISHTRGGAGIDDTVVANDWYLDIAEYLEDYGTNILDSIEGEPIEALTTVQNEVIGIPSVISPYKFGILVRKDWMEACGYTDDAQKAQTEFTAGVNYKLVDNLATFEEMCLAMKEKYNLNHVITGAPWDLEKVLTLGAFGDSGYFTYTTRTDGEGNEYVVPGFATDEYKDVLQLEYNWASKGITSDESEIILLEQGKTNFISGKTGVFVLDPTVTHLIKVARRCKAIDPSAEFTVLGALTETADTTKKGFMKNSPATFAACIMKTSQNALAIIQFINWVYANEDNYNLCRYGIEGVHWIDNGDGTYSYPEGKESYITSPPYSGILTLVENQNVSNLIYAGYSDEEKAWLATAAQESNYIENDLINYLWPSAPASILNSFTQQKQTLYGRVSEAWSGRTNPSSGYAAAVSAYLSGGGQAYQDFLTSQYKIMKLQRES